LIWTQEHAPLHGWVALQRPLQTPIAPGLFCNCRAETVLAQRTLMTSVVKSVALSFLFMIVSFRAQLPDERGARAFRFGCYEIAHAYSGSGVVEDAGATQNVGAPCFLGAEATAGGGLDIQRQLAGGNRAHAQNGRHHR
jgi:hypothetical protein